MDNKLQELTSLLQKSLDLYEKDRMMAIQNYNALRKQLDKILIETEMSEEGKIEKETNSALKLVFNSGKRLDNIILTISKIITNQTNSESKERIANILTGNMSDGKLINKPVDITKLLEENVKENKED